MPNRLRPNAELTRDVANAGARRGQQDHPGTLRQLPWRRMRAHQPGQHLLLGGGGHNGFGRQTRHGNLANRETNHRFAMTHRGPLDSPARQLRDNQPDIFPGCGNPDSPPRPWSRYLRRAAVGTLERWRAEALANAGGDSGGGDATRWTAVARLEAVIATAAMDEATRAAWCREQGLYPLELDGWKQDAISGLGEPRDAETAETKQNRRRIKELERDLNRKDKALAETAALLVLSKKLSAIFHEGADA